MKTEDQTQEVEETQDVETVETKKDDTSTAAAVKTSTDFDKLLDAEGVDESPLEEDGGETKDDDKGKDDSKAEDKDSGQEKDDAEKTDTGKKDATDTGESPISKELAQKAIDLGLTEEQVGQLESDNSLAEMVTAIESVTSVPTVAATETVAAKAVESKDDEPKDDSAIKFENEDDIDPELLENIKGMEQRRQSDRKEIEALKQTVNTLVGSIEATARAEFTARFDGMIAEQGIEFADTFGVGSTLKLDAQSKAFQNRNAIRARMVALGTAMSEGGELIPPEKQLFDLAVNSMFKDKVETVKSSRLSKKTAKYKKGGQIGRTSTKRTGSQMGYQRAVETSRNFDDLLDSSED